MKPSIFVPLKLSVMKWDKDTKEKIQYASAVLMLVSGTVMGFLALGMNGWHTIPDSVLWFVAQCFVYAGSIFGVAMVINYKFDRLRDMVCSGALNKLHHGKDKEVSSESGQPYRQNPA